MAVTLVSAVLCFSLSAASRPSAEVHINALTCFTPGQVERGKNQKQNTFVHFAFRRSIEVPICNGGGKAYC